MSWPVRILPAIDESGDEKLLSVIFTNCSYEKKAEHFSLIYITIDFFGGSYSTVFHLPIQTWSGATILGGLFCYTKHYYTCVYPLSVGTFVTLCIHSAVLTAITQGNDLQEA